MLSRILCVDDEVNVLKGIERHLRGKFDVETAAGPELGLKALKDQPHFAAVLSDLRMPGMDGIQFLCRARELAPDTVRLMLTGNADLSDAIAAVNRGSIFQFLTKPCPPELLISSLQAAVRQHALITAERELLEKTLLASVGVLTEILSIVNPAAFSQSQRVRRYVRELAKALGLTDAWQCELAAMVSQVGLVTLPAAIILKLRNGEKLAPGEILLVETQQKTGHDLIQQIPRLEPVAKIVAAQKQLWGIRERAHSATESRGHLLRVAFDFDEQVMLGGSPGDIVARMRSNGKYDPSFLSALESIQIDCANSDVRQIRLEHLQPGMILNSDVYSKAKLLMLARGQEVTPSMLACLRRCASTVGIEEPISVVVRHEHNPGPPESQCCDLYPANSASLS